MIDNARMIEAHLTCAGIKSDVILGICRVWEKVSPIGFHLFPLQKQLPKFKNRILLFPLYFGIGRGLQDETLFPDSYFDFLPSAYSY